MSVSEQPRLADRQPSFRGGVPRVRTWHRAIRLRCKRGPSATQPSAHCAQEASQVQASSVKGNSHEQRLVI